ncbi:GNAT family N-acetyltransferase [Saccharibacillus kuerlensis]|uniref:N-acetyltransferase domain-containing protein n=1 Tax=Saccharibacillus kuerlensis TaxID=459527 RepID=A0ABQ2L2F6_9BACL|nr:GNAT family N-acetyltransferase [Saccharibacillus kuerlensis]GGO00369.1 hypothetical protein GCM10010969_21480 [Saccharibacillus kuerlensis]
MGMTIETERLILRDAVPEDWAAIHEYSSDPQVVKYSMWGPNTEEQTREYIAQVIEMQRERPRMNYELAVTLRESGRLIGGCGIHKAGFNAEIGYTFNPRFGKKGYATEAAFALLQFGFETIGRSPDLCDLPTGE